MSALDQRFGLKALRFQFPPHFVETPQTIRVRSPHQGYNEERRLDREDVLILLDASLQPIFEEQFEPSTRITSLRFLLEDLFADQFSARLPEFTARMDRLLELTPIASVQGGSASAEQLSEMKVRVATHLERFRSETERKIAARSSG